MQTINTTLLAAAVVVAAARVGRVGRADTLGLAISLISPVEEKVWYCTVKGYKPWLEPNADNTRTQDRGGHTIWYGHQLEAPVALLRRFS
jgi:hypothetical protein